MIYNAPSIYKQGGGGGGYKDGGELVDGDFIKVENNSISTYENTTRNEINFYVELNQDETLNTVIEITNNYNATVYFWIVNPETGIFTPLGNIGGDTVTAGEEYNVNATGNSYTVEQVATPTPDPNNYVQMLYGHGCRFKKIGDYYWQTENNIGIIPGVPYIAANGTVYYQLKGLYDQNNNFEHDYILPNGNIVQNLYTSLGRTTSNAGQVLKDVVGWAASAGNEGDNSAGLNFQGNGWIYNGSTKKLNEEGSWAYSTGAGDTTSFSFVYNTKGIYASANLNSDRVNCYATVRFVKRAT